MYIARMEITQTQYEQLEALLPRQRGYVSLNNLQVLNTRPSGNAARCTSTVTSSAWCRANHASGRWHAPGHSCRVGSPGDHGQGRHDDRETDGPAIEGSGSES